jgi:hypothetical protein
MKKIVVLAALMGLLYPNLSAQSDVDALRYSLTSPIGSTARGIGLGGAIGAVGADQSAVLSNPAGLAQYKRGSFNISVGSITLKNESQYLDGPTKTSNIFKPTLPSINYVATERKMRNGVPAKKGFVNYSFLVGWNKTADFNRTVSYKGENSQSSLTDYVANYAQGLDASALDANDEQLNQGFYYFENMFWYSYLIDSLNNGNYYANYDNANMPIAQSGKIISKGGMNEFNMAFAANYEHKVYFGFGLNIHSVKYSERNVFSETDHPLTDYNWSSYDFTRRLETSGYGYSGRFGMIFRPNNNFRIGGTIHTPTVLTLTDEYYDELYVLHDDGGTDDLRTIDKDYTYSITTPMKYGVQAAYIFGKKGLVSAELESVDYSTMNLSSDDFLFESSNETISDKYQSTVNLKVGAEYVFDAFRLRGGFASIGNPLANESDYSRKLISGGIGIQERNWGFDFGIVKDITTDSYVPYEVPGMSSNGVSSTAKGTQLMLTLSTKF